MVETFQTSKPNNEKEVKTAGVGLINIVKWENTQWIMQFRGLFIWSGNIDDRDSCEYKFSS
jgi:hypothetical protein